MKKAGSADKKKQKQKSQSQLNSQEQAIAIQNLQQETSKQFLKKLEQRLKRVYEIDQTNKNDFIAVSQIKEQVHETLEPIITECKMIYSTISSQESKNIEFEDQISKIQEELTKNMRLYEDVTRILKMIQMLEATDNKTNEKLRDLKQKQKADHKELSDKFKLQDLTNQTNYTTIEEYQKRLITLHEEFDKFLEAQGKIQIEFDINMTSKFEQMQLQLDSFKFQNEQRDKNHKEITSSIKNQLDGNIKTIMKSHQKEMENLLKLEISVKQVTEMKKKIIIMEPQIKEIQIKQQSLIDLPNFVEKVLPFYNMIQISEALKKVLVINPDNKNYESIQSKIQNYEVIKIQQILEYNEESKGMEIDIKSFNKRLMAMAKGFGKEKCGITQFVMGKDYNSQMNTQTPEFEKLSYEHLSDLKKLKQQQVNNKSQQQILQNIMEIYDQLHHLLQTQEINQLKEKANANKMLMKAQKPQQKVEISVEELALIKNLYEQIKLLDKQWLKVFQDQVMQKKFEWNEYEPLIYKYCKMDDLEKLKTHLTQEQRNLAIKNQRQNNQKTSPERQKAQKSPQENTAIKADISQEQDQDQGVTQINKQQLTNKKGKETAQVIEKKGKEKQQLKQTKQIISTTANKLDSIEINKTQDVSNPQKNNQQQNSQQSKNQVQINSYQSNQQQDLQNEIKEDIKQLNQQELKNEIKIQDQRQQKQEQNQLSSQIKQKEYKQQENMQQENRQQEIKQQEKKSQENRQQETQNAKNIDQNQKQTKPEIVDKHKEEIQNNQQYIEEDTDELKSQSKEKGNIFDQISTQNLQHIPTQQDEINRFTPINNTAQPNKNILSKNNISDSVSRKTIQNQTFKKNSSIGSKSKNQSLKSKILSSKSNQFKIQNDSRQKITDVDQNDDQEDGDENYGEEEFQDNFNDGIIIFKSFFRNNVRQLLRKNNLMNKKLQNQIQEIYKKINRILNMMPQNYENKQQPKSVQGGSITVNVEPGVKEHINQIVKQIDADAKLEYDKIVFKTKNIQNYQNLMAIENIIQAGNLEALNKNQKDLIVQYFYEQDSQKFFPHNLKKDAELYIKALQSKNPQKSLNKEFIKENNKELLNDKFTNQGKEFRLNQAFMKLIRIKQLNEQRPAMETGMSEFSDQQIQQIQQMIDLSIDWLKICMTTSFSLHIEDLNASFQNLHSDFEAHSQLNNSRIKATEGKIIDCLCSVNFVEEKYKVDHQFFKQFKQRLHSDLKHQIQQIKYVADQSALEVKMSNQQSSNIKKILEILIESNMIESIIQDQELIDKQKLFLLGVKNNSDLIGQNHNFINLESYDQQQILQKNKQASINISEAQVNEEIEKNSPKIKLIIKKNEIENTHIQDKNDFLGMNLPTTHPNHFVQMLKKACLAYSCTPVQYGNQLLSQKEIRQKKKNLLYEAQNLHNQNIHQAIKIEQTQSQQNDKDDDITFKQDNTIERDDLSPKSALQIHKINYNTNLQTDEKMDGVYQVKIQNKLDQVFTFLNDDAQYNKKNTNLSSISNIHLQPQLQNKNDHKNQTSFIIKKDIKPKIDKQNLNQQRKNEKNNKLQSDTKEFDSLRNSTNFKSVNQGKKQSVPGIFGALDFMPHGSQTNSTFDVWIDKSINLQKQIEGFNKKEMQNQILKEKQVKDGIEQFNKERKLNQSQNFWKRKSVGSIFDNSQDQNIYKSYDSGAEKKAASQLSTIQGLDIRTIFIKDSNLPLQKDFPKQKRLSQDFINSQQQNNIHHVPIINTRIKQTEIENVQSPTLDFDQQNLQSYKFQNINIQNTNINDKRKANQFQNLSQMKDYLERPNTSVMAPNCTGLNMMIKQNSKQLSKKSHMNNQIISDNNSDSASNQKHIKSSNINNKKMQGLTENNSQGGLAGLISGIQIKTQSPHIKSSKQNQDSQKASKMKIEENTNDLHNQRTKIQSQQYNINKKVRYSMDYSTIQDDQNNQKYFQGANHKFEQNSMISAKGSQRQIGNLSGLIHKDSGMKNSSIKIQISNQDSRNLKKVVGTATVNNQSNAFDIKDSLVTRQLHPIPFNSFTVQQNES